MDRLANEIKKVIAEGLYTFYHVKEFKTADDYQKKPEKVRDEYVNNFVFHSMVDTLVCMIMRLISEREVKK